MDITHVLLLRYCCQSGTGRDKPPLVTLGLGRVPLALRTGNHLTPPHTPLHLLSFTSLLPSLNLITLQPPNFGG